jgi:hypothetical protein
VSNEENGGTSWHGDHWVIAVAHGMRFVGRLQGTTLDPAYELQVQMGPNGQGGVAIAHSAIPMCLLPSWKVVTLPVGALVQPLQALSKADRDILFNAAKQAEEIARSIRSAQSGIVPVAPGLTLPPMRRP